MHKEFQFYLPFREPRWRCARVDEMMSSTPPARPSRRTDDEYIVRYRNFRVKWRERPNDTQRLVIFADDPPMCYAHMVFHYHDHEWRWLLEAHLLTGESDERIAAEFGTLPETVHLYEKIFYNVRDRLRNEQWVLKQIIGELAARQVETRRGQMTTEQWQMLMKLFAYYGGRDALRAIVAAFPHAPPQDLADVDHWLDKAFINGVRRNALVASRIVEVNRFTSVQLMELYLRLIRVNNEALSAGSPSQYEKNVEDAIAKLEWVIGGDPQPASLPAAERRDRELVARWRKQKRGSQCVAETREDEELPTIAIRVSSCEERKNA